MSLYFGIENHWVKFIQFKEITADYDVNFDEYKSWTILHLTLDHFFLNLSIH